jgi:uroporphyrinogen-III synthase
VVIILTTTKEKCLETSLKYPDLSFYSFPCIEYAKPNDDYKSLDAAIRANHLYEWVFFLSEKSAEVFFERLIAIGGNFFNLSNHLKFAVIGDRTREFLERDVNMPVDFMPSKANSETFIQEFCALYKFDFECGFKILLPRSELAFDDFKSQIELSKNYLVDIVPAYNTVKPFYSVEQISNLKSKLDSLNGIVFTSSSCVQNFHELTNYMDLNPIKIYSIGSKTTKTIRNLYQSHTNIVEAKEASLDSMLKAIC